MCMCVQALRGGGRSLKWCKQKRHVTYRLHKLTPATVLRECVLWRVRVEGRESEKNAIRVKEMVMGRSKVAVHSTLKVKL